MVLYYGLIVGFFTAFLLILLKKLGIVDKMQILGNEFVRKLASCDFCMSFWLSVLICLAAFPFLGAEVLFSPFIGCVISRFLQ